MRRKIEYQEALTKLKEVVNNIPDKKTRKICSSYLDDLIKNKTKKRIEDNFFHFRLVFKAMAKISIDDIDDNFVFEHIALYLPTGSYWFYFFKKVYLEYQIPLFENNKHKFKFFEYKPNNIRHQQYVDGSINPEHFIYVETTNKRKKYIIYPPKTTPYISKLLTECYRTDKDIEPYRSFLEDISEYLYEKNTINIYSDISDDFIEEFYDKYGKDKDNFWYIAARFFFTWVLKSLSNKVQIEKCPRYNIQVLMKKNYAKYRPFGAVPVIYNKFDKVPKYDFWLIIPNGDIKGSTRLNYSSLLSTDFSLIKNKGIRELVKQYIWYGNKNIISKVKDFRNLKYSLNMLFPEEEVIYKEITINDCAKFKSYLMANYSVPDTRADYMSSLKAFVKFVKERKLIEVDKNCILCLTSPGILNKNKAKGCSKEDLIKIAKVLEQRKNNSITDLQKYVIFHLCLNTEFRISQIMNLKIDCVKESLKKNEYVIVSNTKVSGGMVVEQPCARIVKNIIDDYLQVTAGFREQCPDKKIKQNLFIDKDPVTDVYSSISIWNMTKWLNELCIELNINNINTSNLRITYITNAKEYILKNNLSDANLLGITGHKSVDMINNHYFQEKIRDALQATHNVIIGDVDINGNIVKNKDLIHSNNENIVENGCGYCQSEFCDLNGPLSCLLCKHFATTIDRIPFFKKQIDILDESILKATIPHDKEDIVAIKRLFLRYLEELINVKEFNNGK